MAFLFNMGLPMIVPALYFMVLGLIPIVLIESLYVARKLQMRFSRTIGSVALANIISTIVGIPFTWLLLFVIQLATGGASNFSTAGFASKIRLVTLQAPWLPPLEPDESWIFHCAALFLLIPFFFATWLIEYRVIKTKMMSEMPYSDPQSEIQPERVVSLAVRNANILSYGLIAILLVTSLILTTLSPR